MVTFHLQKRLEHAEYEFPKTKVFVILITGGMGGKSLVCDGSAFQVSGGGGVSDSDHPGDALACDRSFPAFAFNTLHTNRMNTSSNPSVSLQLACLLSAVLLTLSTAAQAAGGGKLRINIKMGRLQMKKTWIAVALALLAGCAKKAPEPVVNLSGFELGGNVEQVTQAPPNWKSITIGGVPSYYVHLGPSADFGTDNRLRSLMFLFKSTSFSQVVGNVSSKYPGLACKDSRGSHPNGSASFDQTVCSMRVKGGELVIQRVYGDVVTSVLTLKSDAVIAEKK